MRQRRDLQSASRGCDALLTESYSENDGGRDNVTAARAHVTPWMAVMSVLRG